MYLYPEVRYLSLVDSDLTIYLAKKEKQEKENGGSHIS